MARLGCFRALVMAAAAAWFCIVAVAFGQNRPVRSVSALGSGSDDTHYATTTTCDAVGYAASVTNPEGNATRCAYDLLGERGAAAPRCFKTAKMADWPGLVCGCGRTGRDLRM